MGRESSAPCCHLSLPLPWRSYPDQPRERNVTVTLCCALWVEIITMIFWGNGLRLLRVGQIISGWTTIAMMLAGQKDWFTLKQHSESQAPLTFFPDKSDSFSQPPALLPQHLPVQNMDQNVCFVKGSLNFRGKQLCWC